METNVFWNWSGRFIGYRSADSLFSSDGRELGSFAEGDELYGVHGEYIGEVRGGNRLITNLSKKKWTRASFLPRVLKSSPGHKDVSPKVMLTGFEDFCPIVLAQANHSRVEL